MTETYRADLKLVALWVGLCGIPVPISTIDLIGKGWNAAGSLVIASLIPPLLVLIFVSRFKVSFSEDEFIYRRWGPTVRISYSDIVGLEVTNVTPIERQAIGAFVITGTGKTYPFWPKLFPPRAVERFFTLGPIRS